MPDAVFGGEIHIGPASRLFGHKFVNRGIGAISQKHRPGLGIERFDVAHPVVFLVGPGQFVFFDGAIEVFRAARRGDNAGLRVAAHDLPVKIKVRPGIRLQRAVTDGFLKIFRAPGINFRRIGSVPGGRSISGLLTCKKLSGLPAATSRASSDDITS